MIRALRDEALRLLNGGGAILEAARDVSNALLRNDIDGAVIGGVAVVLHGYVRTTADVDVYVSHLDLGLKDALAEAGFQFRRGRREFVRDGIPVHIVPPEDVSVVPREFEVVEGIRTVALSALIDMKLASGLKNILRAIDLADVVGLIRCRKLSPTFAGRLVKPLRADFRKLARAVSKSK